MRIAIVVRRFPIVSDTFVLDHALGLLERGHEVEILSALPGDDMCRGPGWNRFIPQRNHFFWQAAQGLRGASLLAAGHRLPSRQIPTALRHLPDLMRRRGDPFALWSLLVSRPAFDLVHAHFAGTGEHLAFLKARDLLRVPLVVSVHGFDVTPHAHRGDLPYRHLPTQADRVVATTRFLGEQTLRLGIPADRLTLNPSGLDLAQFPFRPPSWRPGQPLRLLSVARLVEVKGIRHALAAIARLRRDGLAVHCTLIGEGPLRTELEQLAGALGLADAVRFLGARPRTEVIAEFARHHVLVLSSCTTASGQREAQGLVLLEAQACGLPVVGTRHGGIPEMLQEGVTGELAAEADPDDLARAVRRLLDRGREWDRIGAAGRAWVESRFSLVRHLDQTEAIYRPLVHRRCAARK